MTIEVCQIFQHPNFNVSTFNFDFAILQFQENLTFSEKIKPVKLPNDFQNLKAGQNCLVSGFGLINPDSFDYPRGLQATEVTIIDLKRCKESYMEAGFEITNQMLCAGVENPISSSGNNDACAGDSVSGININF